MTDLSISRELADKLVEIAQHEQKSLEDLLTEIVEHRDVHSSSETGSDVPAEIANSESYQNAIRTMRDKLYRKARTYWEQVGDQERLALTDQQLSDQFWLIDPDGIPRLKSDRGTFHLPPDPLEAIVDLFPDSNLTDMSLMP